MSTKPSKGLNLAIPKQAYNGDWWDVPAMMDVRCPQCGKVTESRPTVARYVKARDFFDEFERFEPLWPERGWRVWWDCRACGWEWHKQEENSYATTKEIQGWITDFQRWYLSFGWRSHDSILEVIE